MTANAPSSVSAPDRAALVHRLATAARADWACVVGLRAHAGRLWFADCATAGLAQGEPPLHGHPFDGRWAPFAPGRARERFGRVPPGSGSARGAAMFVYDGPTFVARVELRWAARGAGAPAAEAKAAADGLRAMSRGEDGAAAGAVAIARADGSIERHGGELDPAAREAIAVATRAVHQGEERSVVAGLAVATCQRLVGAGLEPRYCWIFEPAERPRRAEDGLTDRRRRVAELAVLGWTTRRIGAELGISAETAKRHLAAVYQLLDVASRVELRRALDEVRSSPDRGMSGRGRVR